jgi:hypothetical protein
MLTSVRDAYSTAFGFYAQAAAGYQNAGAATGGLAPKLVTQAQGDSAKAGEAMDSAASLLARVMVQYHLPVTQQMPGESSTGFGNRTGAAQPPPGGLGVDQNGQPIDPTQVPGQAPSPTGTP